jgi:hypothetical protein
MFSRLQALPIRRYSSVKLKKEPVRPPAGFWRFGNSDRVVQSPVPVTRGPPERGCRDLVTRNVVVVFRFTNANHQSSNAERLQ